MVSRPWQDTLQQALIFVDTSGWYALKATDDRFHDDAVSFYDMLKAGRHGSLVVSDYVLDETATLLMATKGGAVAADFLDEALESKSVWLGSTGPLP